MRPENFDRFEKLAQRYEMHHVHTPSVPDLSQLMDSVGDSSDDWFDMLVGFLSLFS